MTRHTGAGTAVGVIANPASARDIRRLIGNATSLQTADRANIVLRAVAALGASGVERVVMMPDKGGICAFLKRALERERAVTRRHWPAFEFLDMRVTSTVDDTLLATERMVTEGVKAIIVLGGDGTHRAVAGRCRRTPIAGLSTGTNNVFPEYREPTITGLATGLFATGQVPQQQACRMNKTLAVRVNGAASEEIALVDVMVTAEPYVGARALWKPDNFRKLFVTFAEPDAIGMSAIAGLLHPISRDDPAGLCLSLGPPEGCRRRLKVAIAPGLVRDVGVESFREIKAGERVRVEPGSGSVAFDGEREIELSPGDRMDVVLQTDSVLTIDVLRTMRFAAHQGLLLDHPFNDDAKEKMP